MTVTAKDSVLLVEDIDGVRVLTLNRPEVRNALDDDLYNAVRSTLQEASANTDVAACVITAVGDVFCAGQDLRDIERARAETIAGTQAFIPFTRALADFDKPLIAAVNGAATGAGFTMLLHCDFIFVSEAARFRAPFASLGIVPEGGSSLLLPARVGPQVAAGMLFTGAWMGAEEAVATGLAWRCLPTERLREETLKFAIELVKQPRPAVLAAKRLLLAARSAATHSAIDRELVEVAELLRSTNSDS